MKNGNINQGIIDRRIRGNLFQPEGDDFSKKDFNYHREDLTLKGSFVLSQMRKEEEEKKAAYKKPSGDRSRAWGNSMEEENKTNKSEGKSYKEIFTEMAKRQSKRPPK